MLAFTYPLIVLSGAFQAMGAALSALLRKSLVNPWLAAFVTFVPIIIVLTFVVFAIPFPLPQIGSFAKIHWYDAFGGVAGSAAVVAGLLLVDKVGSGPLNGLTVTGNILASLALDAFGVLGLHKSGFEPLPWIGGAIMIIGVIGITRGARKKDDEEEDKGLAGKLLYPFILVCGGLQAIGAALNAELRHAVTNPWMAADLSFIPVASLFLLIFILRPTPLPTRDDVATVRWWMPTAGLVGALAVFTGLLFIDKVGAGVFNGLLITANLIMAVVLDHFGWLGMEKTPTTRLRLAGVIVTIIGILMISIGKMH
ncbi:MAG: DMT family transporter [Sphingomonas parapaucimobilis]